METMETKKTIAVLGGDKRQAYAAQALMRAGLAVRQFGVPEVPGVEQGEPCETIRAAVKDADYVLAPVPFKDMSEEALVANLEQGQIFFAGMLPESLAAHCKAEGIECHDLLEREDFAVLNAISTAEGAVAEAILAGDINLHLSSALVLGYGRCGRPLVKKLLGLGVRVTVATRRWEAACAAIADGCDVLDFQLMPYHLPRFQYIFNTVPAVLLGEEELARVAKETVIIDIAAAPGGLDYERAEALELNAKLCPGLPGKYAPRTTGESIAQITRIILEEREGFKWGDWNMPEPESE